MTRKPPAFIFVLWCLALLFGGRGYVVYAKSGGEPDRFSPLHAEHGNIFTFEELGYKEKVMVGPYDAVRIFFSLPSTWQLNTDATLTLRLNVVGGDSTQQGNWLAGTLRVSLNNVVLDTLLLDQNGVMTKVFAIPADALKPVSEDGRYLLTLFYDASFNCDHTDIRTSLVISASSEFDFEHFLVPFTPDLSKFPRPMYQPQSIIPTSTTIIVPDKPSAVELQSAFSISSGLGSLTNGELDIPLIPLSKLSADIASTSNLILVGLPSKLPILKSVSLPIPIIGDKLVLNGTSPEDGILQMAVSPWNQTGVVLYAGGNSEVGLLKAGQALGGGNIVPAGWKDVSVISSVNPSTREGDIPEDRTFAALGYDNELMGGAYGQFVSYVFSASSEQASSSDAYIDMVTSHSKLLDFAKSGLTVFLNGSVIGSIQYTDQTDQVTTTRLNVIPGILRRGNNRLEVVGDLVPIYNCLAPDLSSNTVTISESSLIHLPATSQSLLLANNLDLKNFPSMFISDKSLSDLAIIVPQSDPTAWEYASKVAYYIGFKGNVPLANLQVAFGDAVPDQVRKERNLLIVGRASTLPIIADLKDSLPAPFEPGKDEATQPALLVNYRLLPEVSVGYLQLLTSPWNPARAILAIMGNTEKGIPMAGEKLIREDLAGQLKGNFSILYGDQILTTDTRLGPTKEELAGSLPVVVTVTPAVVAPTPLSPLAEPQVQGRAGWILPVFLAMTLVIVVIVLIVIRNALVRAVPARKLEHPDHVEE